MNHPIEPKKCSRSSCHETYIPTRNGALAAAQAGWFLQRTGQSWCPSHIPSWVEEWRKQKAMAENPPPKGSRGKDEPSKEELEEIRKQLEDL